MTITKQIFHSPTAGKLQGNALISEIINYMESDHKSTYRLIIGTDSRSQNHSQLPSTVFVSAIVIHRVGLGARYFWSRIKSSDKQYQILRNKIYQETILSLDLAKQIVPVLKTKLNGQKYDLEIHIDVGEAGPTREMIREVVGMVTGSGYVAKTKPDSYGASTVADKHT